MKTSQSSQLPSISRRSYLGGYKPPGWLLTKSKKEDYSTFAVTLTRPLNWNPIATTPKPHSVLRARTTRSQINPAHARAKLKPLTKLLTPDPKGSIIDPRHSFQKPSRTIAKPPEQPSWKPAQPHTITNAFPLPPTSFNNPTTTSLSTTSSSPHIPSQTPKSGSRLSFPPASFTELSASSTRPPVGPATTLPWLGILTTWPWSK